ncbi:MAG: trypsin-like peptidase domain-containing protein [Planctomycetes bacterium]|nr:trypsin-like peptidase domain-containing protein [Planctomycetota bacterium]
MAAESQAVVARGNLAEDERSTIELFEKASPSVVHVVCIRNNEQTGRTEFGSGSGFIWDRDGRVVTNHHVIANFQKFLVILWNGQSCPAIVRGEAPTKDLAVLEIEKAFIPNEGLKPVMLGTSADLKVGQKVFAIGNPYRLDQTLTNGIISGLQREIQSSVLIHEAIQTSAAINPGNSGGPLLDSAGRVVGVNSAVYKASGTGFGFALPIDMVRRVVRELIEHGVLERVGIGIRAWPDGTALDLLKDSGVLVMQVEKGGPADRAGIRPSVNLPDSVQLGDLIIAANRQKVVNLADLHRILDNCQAGDEVILTIMRDGAKRDIPVKLEVIH